MEENTGQAKKDKDKKEKGADRGRETLFRTSYRNQSNLIQIADNKANIIISINTMIISSIVAITGYGAVAGKIEAFESRVLVPITLIILSSLISVIFAVQAARPKLIRAKPNGQQKSSLLFFGVAVNYSQEVYLKKMAELLESKEEVYEHMTIDLYNQSLVLKRKYTLLSYAYQIFLYGFIFSVLVFLGFLALS